MNSNCKCTTCRRVTSEVVDVECWMIFHRARNQTSHVYDEQVAKDVYASATEFLPVAKKMLAALEARND